jgi:hypothetical protein
LVQTGDLHRLERSVTAVLQSISGAAMPCSCGWATILLIRLCMAVRVLQALELKQWCSLTKCLPPERLPVVRSACSGMVAAEAQATAQSIVGKVHAVIERVIVLP